jgi:hypothetical protein
MEIAIWKRLAERNFANFSRAKVGH